MSIFFKYILKEVTISCTVAVLLFVGVLVFGNAIRDIFEWIASGRLSFFESLKILSIIIPSVVSYALPLGVLTGILVTVGKLSSSNELLTMKSIGISIYKISIPMFLFALIATILSCFINLYYAPDSITEYRGSFKKILRENPIRFIHANEFMDWFAGYIIYVDSIQDTQLSNFKIWQFSSKGNAIDCYITAEHGRITYDDVSRTIMLALFDGSAEYFTAQNSNEGSKHSKMMFFKELSLSLPINGIFDISRQPEKKLRHMNIYELMYARQHWRSNKSEILTSAVLKKDKSMVDMQISNNIAMSFGVLAMACVALPLGVRKNRSDTSTNVLLALVLAFSYYFTMVVLSWFGDKTDIHPEVLIWCPNILLMIFGIHMLRKISRN